MILNTLELTHFALETATKLVFLSSTSNKTSLGSLLSEKKRNDENGSYFKKKKSNEFMSFFL